jgi:hypothetical protein
MLAIGRPTLPRSIAVARRDDPQMILTHQTEKIKNKKQKKKPPCAIRSKITVFSIMAPSPGEGGARARRYRNGGAGSMKGAVDGSEPSARAAGLVGDREASERRPSSGRGGRVERAAGSGLPVVRLLILPVSS